MPPLLPLAAAAAPSATAGRHARPRSDFDFQTPSASDPSSRAGSQQLRPSEELRQRPNEFLHAEAGNSVASAIPLFVPGDSDLSAARRPLVTVDGDTFRPRKGATFAQPQPQPQPQPQQPQPQLQQLTSSVSARRRNSGGNGNNSSPTATSSSEPATVVPAADVRRSNRRRSGAVPSDASLSASLEHSSTGAAAEASAATGQHPPAAAAVIARPIVICCTALSAAATKEVEADVRAIGATYSASFEPQRSTHVVTPLVDLPSASLDFGPGVALEAPPGGWRLTKRTLKYMFGILQGAHIVTADWLRACVKAGCVTAAKDMATTDDSALCEPRRVCS